MAYKYNALKTFFSGKAGRIRKNNKMGEDDEKLEEILSWREGKEYIITFISGPFYLL